MKNLAGRKCDCLPPVDPEDVDESLYETRYTPSGQTRVKCIHGTEWVNP